MTPTPSQQTYGDMVAFRQGPYQGHGIQDNHTGLLATIERLKAKCREYEREQERLIMRQDELLETLKGYMEGAE